jgi:hypothetical protein
LVVAGGGGSSGGAFQATMAGGHGGGVGEDGSNGYTTSSAGEPYGDVGLAGTTTAAGLGGGGWHPSYPGPGYYRNPIQNPTYASPPVNGTNNGGDGGALAGGSAINGTYNTGGGGGGYYGGGAGGAHVSPNIYYNMGGGGGSGYIVPTTDSTVNGTTVKSLDPVAYPGGPGTPGDAPDPPRNFTGPGATYGPLAPTPISNAAANTGNMDAPYYTNGVGVGGLSGVGGDGEIQIAVNGGSFTTYTYTGSAQPVTVSGTPSSVIPGDVLGLSTTYSPG